MITTKQSEATYNKQVRKSNTADKRSEAKRSETNIEQTNNKVKRSEAPQTKAKCERKNEYAYITNETRSEARQGE
jgi:hypothetical protein